MDFPRNPELLTFPMGFFSISHFGIFNQGIIGIILGLFWDYFVSFSHFLDFLDFFRNPGILNLLALDWDFFVGWKIPQKATSGLGLRDSFIYREICALNLAYAIICEMMYF